MRNAVLHHVTVLSTDLEKSRAFYTKALGLQALERPPFPIPGLWLANGPLMVHINLYPGATFRKKGQIDGDDIHFAVRVPVFEEAVAHLAAAGFREDAAEDNPNRMLVKRTGKAGFPQVFIMDPDNNQIEINAPS